MTVEQKYLLILIRCAINDTKVPVPDEKLSWEKLYAIAVEHGVTQLIWQVLQKSEFIDKLSNEIRQGFNKQQKIVIIKDANIEYEIEKIKKDFLECGIRFIILKGYVMRSYYPESFMRTMSDVDILYDTSQTAQVREVLAKNKFALKSSEEKNDVFVSKNSGMIIEMHRNLIPFSEDEKYQYAKDVFKRAVYNDGCYEMTKEDFYIFILMHLARHFFEAGIGIKAFVDIWLIKLKEKNNLDSDYIDRQLEFMNLKTFDKKVNDMLFNWFNDKKFCGTDEDILNYAFGSGKFGKCTQFEINEAAKRRISEKSISKRVLMLRRTFPPYEEMVKRQQWLKNKKILLPVGWIKLNLERLLFRRSYIKGRIKNIQEIDEKNVISTQQLFERLGL